MQIKIFDRTIWNIYLVVFTNLFMKINFIFNIMIIEIDKHMKLIE